MHSEPLVSIIIPTYNRAHLIGETLDSVLAQTYTKWECIIVDDGSTDDTDAVVGAYVNKDPRFKYYHRPLEHLPGGNGARNFGFKMSQGEFIQWFDDDDVMLDNFLQIKIKSFTLNINLVITTHFSTQFDLQTKQTIPLKQTENLFKEYVLWRLKIITGDVLINRDILKGVNLFKEELLRGQETEFFSRLFFDIKSNSYKIINKPLFLYRQHKQSKTFALEEYQNELIESHAYIAIENLKRSIRLNDEKLTSWLYKSVIDFFFRCIEKKDIKNAKNIYHHFFNFLLLENYWLAIKFKLAAILFIRAEKGSYKIEKYFKKYNFKTKNFIEI